jgi:hypothetical protein
MEYNGYTIEYDTIYRITSKSQLPIEFRGAMFTSVSHCKKAIDNYLKKAKPARTKKTASKK